MICNNFIKGYPSTKEEPGQNNQCKFYGEFTEEFNCHVCPLKLLRYASIQTGTRGRILLMENIKKYIKESELNAENSKHGNSD